MNKWFKNCGEVSEGHGIPINRLHCIACRTDAAWRESLRKAGLVEIRDFDCPFLVTPETAQAIQDEAMAKLPGYDAEAVAKAKEQLEAQGRRAWAWLHERLMQKTFTMKAWHDEFLPIVPRYGCGCVAEASRYILDHPLPENPDEHERWGIDFHNFINAKLNKPFFSG